MTARTQGERLLAVAVFAALASAGTAAAAQPAAIDLDRASRAVAMVPANVVAQRRDARTRLGRLGLMQVASRSGAIRVRPPRCLPDRRERAPGGGHRA
jgi:hypothetical protein